MRLIDGSEFFIQACRTFDEVIGLDEVAELLDKMPTVEAIPIEWIRKWTAQHSPLSYVAYMLLDWEKENGRADL